MDHIFTTTALSKRYRHTKALDQLSMQVPRGACPFQNIIS